MRGRGQYVGDIKLPGMLEVAFLRSPLAHARIRSINIPPELRDRIFIADGPRGRRCRSAPTPRCRASSPRPAGPRHRQGAPRRRARRHVRRPDAAPRPRTWPPRSSSTSSRCPPSPTCWRPQARRAAGARALGRQPLPRLQRRGELRGRQGQGRLFRDARAAHLAPGHEPDRGARRGRAVALAARPARRPHLDPAAPHRPLRPRRVPRRRRGPDPRGGARRRRRLRLQGHPAAPRRSRWRGRRASSARRCAGSRTGARTSPPTPTAASITTC